MTLFDLPGKVARGFMADLHKYFAEEDPVKRDAIAVRQLHTLRDFMPARAKLKLGDVKELFDRMRQEDR